MSRIFDPREGFAVPGRDRRKRYPCHPSHPWSTVAPETRGTHSQADCRHDAEVVPIQESKETTDGTDSTDHQTNLATAFVTSEPKKRRKRPTPLLVCATIPVSMCAKGTNPPFCRVRRDPMFEVLQRAPGTAPSS